ncbi:hypothetical protein N7492_005888 [Penicillium capsulatum]|uniref:Uncharacterized protein n=1 Tax=Penicillium capsulatum TaxID=69766 RepID=A0A9W9IAG9_9EURO|nr:hypothetical protein N7492_005888 [Penicillium capsulatum]KAJ6135010.1 hypothetical protein N7512_000170 [Penicillium capsulatum]
MWKSILPYGRHAARATPIRPKIENTTLPLASRPFRTASPLQKEAAPDIHDRTALNPERSEVTKSGTDSEVAHHPSAYDPTNTSPENELEATHQESQREGKDGNPLNMSPANKDVSAWRGPREGGPERNAEREASSAKGKPIKKRSVHVKDDGTHVSYRD